MQPGSSIIRAADLRPRPWPNGLGITRDVASQDRPGAQAGSGFSWLISIADLTTDADFSDFPGYDRVFTIIEGQGVTLTLRDRGPLPCPPWVPAAFPGDHPSHCTMQGGTARAFNLFVEREGFAGQVSVRGIAPSHPLQTTAATVAVYCAQGVLQSGEASLRAGDTLLRPGAVVLRATAEAAIAVIVEVWPLATATGPKGVAA